MVCDSRTTTTLSSVTWWIDTSCPEGATSSCSTPTSFACLTRNSAAFVKELRSDAATITDSELSVLLSSEWRSRLSASWMIAAGRRATYAKRLGELLMVSDLTYQGQGFCAALAAIGDATSVECLRSYLDRWLPRTDCRYDQEWAMAALILVDERSGTSNAQHFGAPGGAWESRAWERTDLVSQIQALRSALEAIGVR